MPLEAATLLPILATLLLGIVLYVFKEEKKSNKESFTGVHKKINAIKAEQDLKIKEIRGEDKEDIKGLKEDFKEFKKEIKETIKTTLKHAENNKQYQSKEAYALLQEIKAITQSNRDERKKK